MSREITAAQRDWLAGEIDAWHGLGLLTGEQARDVLGLYTTAEQFGKRRQSRALTTLLALSALLVGLGVLLLVAYNWQAMPASSKVALILAGQTIASLLVDHFGWVGFDEQPITPGRLAGVLLLGAGVALVRVS